MIAPNSTDYPAGSENYYLHVQVDILATYVVWTFWYLALYEVCNTNHVNTVLPK